MSNKVFNHYTVMLNEAVDALNCESGKIYVDCTLGGGGHSELILKKIQPDGRLISIDVDDDAINASKERLKLFQNITIVKDSYTNIKKILQDLNIEKITGGVLFDLGASYHQLTSDDRGFSFMKDSPLDMRFGNQFDFNAYDVINFYKEDELVKIFSEYGEEHFSKRIAKKIVEVRKTKKIETTFELRDTILSAVPRIHTKVHPATRVFQAVRIEVNQELQNIKNTLNDVVDLLSFGGIISVISFHSLEDRIVKRFFREKANKCQCEQGFAITDVPPELEIITKKPLVASLEEVKENPPSRSAKLRVAKKIRD